MVSITLVYVIATVYMAYLMRSQLARSLEIEEQRVRPYVSFEITLEDGSVNARIRNLGLTPAINVLVNTSPPLKYLSGGKGCVPKDEAERDLAFIDNAIRYLAPGEEILGLVAFWDRFEKRYPGLEFNVCLSYQGRDGSKYTESYVLNLSSYKFLSIKRKGVQEAVRELEFISRSLSRLVAGNNAILVRTVTNEEYLRSENELIAKAKDACSRATSPDGHA